MQKIINPDITDCARATPRTGWEENHQKRPLTLSIYLCFKCLANDEYSRIFKARICGSWRDDVWRLTIENTWRRCTRTAISNCFESYYGNRTTVEDKIKKPHPSNLLSIARHHEVLHSSPHARFSHRRNGLRVSWKNKNVNGCIDFWFGEFLWRRTALHRCLSMK